VNPLVFFFAGKNKPHDGVQICVFILKLTKAFVLSLVSMILTRKIGLS
jgi:hypothetical protein